jgi:hypothetical protein
MHFSHRILIILGGAALAASAAHAQATLYNNLTATIGNYDPIAGGDQPMPGRSPTHFPRVLPAGC